MFFDLFGRVRNGFSLLFVLALPLGLFPFSPSRTLAAPALDSLVGIALGDPPASGSILVTNGALHLGALGAGIGARADQGYFAYQEVGTNHFDVKVRVEDLAAASLTARAGLMVRDQATNTAAMAAIVVTPGINGIQFLTRTAPEALAIASGSFPIYFPNAWLRLQRSNDTVRGFASSDGRNWTPVGRTTLSMTNALLGFAGSSVRTNGPAAAVFRGWSDSAGESDDPPPPSREPPGPSSRRTALAFTEIHYNPPFAPGDGERAEQFVELFNSDFTAKELGGHRLAAGSLRYVFPTNTILPAGGYLVVAKNPADLRARHPDLAADRVYGPWAGDLDRDADTVQLWSPFDALLLEVPFSDDDPWPLAAGGDGHSLVLARPSWGESHPRAWAASSEVAGSPGRPDAPSIDPRSDLRIVEVFPARSETTVRFLEIYNSGLDPVSLSGIHVAASTDAPRPLFPLPHSTLLSGERLAVDIPASVLGVPTRLLLLDSATGTVFDAVSFSGAGLDGVYGRTAMDRSTLRRLGAPTPGQPNAPVRMPRLVISEVMYKPASGRDDDQYLEIWNPGHDSIRLSGWRITDGVSFEFPRDRALAAGERAVVARNSARLRQTHPNLPAGRILGEFGGRLSARGERLTILDETSTIEFAFTYSPSGEWPALADGGGSSLELLHPELDPELGSSWAASDESGRAGWKTYEVTGVLEGGNGTINDVRVLLLGTGETLVDDIEVLAVGSTNLVSNSGFEGGLGGWSVGGTHDRSGIWTGGGFAGSAQALQLRAAGRGDNGINSARAVLRTGLRAGTNATLRIRARWLAGTRDLLLRVKGNYLELPVRLEVPEDLGSPGLPNSRSLPAPRPLLHELAHFPVLPADGQDVRVTVRIAGNPGVDVPVLRYRLDPSTEFAEPRPMNDTGVDGDRIAGDGFYTARIPAPVARAMAAFHVTLGSGNNEFRVPRTTPGREALVRWGDPQPSGNLGVYRIWITRATESRWNSRAKLHNGDLDGTFVYGATRAVYGLGTLYSGSPFVSPGYNGPAGSTLCGYVLHFPDDDPFLGETDFVMDWPIRDDSRQLEQRAYEFAAEIGLPFLHRRFVHLYVNSAKRGAIYEDTQQPGSAYLRNWSPGDDDGNLHKIEDWFEFTSSGDREFNSDAYLDDFRRSDGSKNTARFRWNFRPRAVQESANDFEALFRLVDAAVPPTQLLEFQKNLEREMDLDEWAGIFAVEHAVGNWDSFGYSRGKNMYAYKPTRGPWRLYMWDIDFVMSAGGEGPGNFPFATIDPTISRLYQYPPFARAYWRAVKRLVNGPMRAERFAARTEAVRTGLIENGVSASGVTAARNYVRDQRTSLLAQLNDWDRPFSMDSVPDSFTTSDPVLRLQGQGPLEMQGLQLAGTTIPVAWLSPGIWYAAVPLREGRNALTAVPVDSDGRTIGIGRSVTVTLAEPPLPESGRIVINEIHVAPNQPGAAFVELHNPSINQGIDMSGLRLVGTGTYEFPANTLIPPRQFLVLGTSVAGFQAEFGRTQFPAGLLGWTPAQAGESLGLVRPARGTNPAVTITAVTYNQDHPWPTLVPGRSLQLRDPSRSEDDRVGAWAVYSPPTNASPWKEFSVTRKAVGTNLLLYVSSFPPSLVPTDLAGRWTGSLTSFGFDFALEFSRNDEGVLSGKLFPAELADDPDFPGIDLSALAANSDGTIRFTWNDLDGRFTGRIDATGRRATGSFTFPNGTSPFTITRQRPPGTVLVDDLVLAREGDPINLLRNGDFQTELGAEWVRDGAHQESSRVDVSDPNLDRLPDFALRLTATLGGDGSITNSVYQTVDGIVSGNTYRLSGRYQAVEAHGVVIGLDDGPRFTTDLRPRVSAGPDATPGRVNSVAAATEPIPLLWINEIQPDNQNGPKAASGRAEPWLEIHNSGILPAKLDGFFLTDDPSKPRKWAFPANANVPAGGFLLVWLDDQPEEGSPTELHASFRPAARNGIVVLSRSDRDGMLAVDYLRYGDVPTDKSFGHLPETWVHSDEVLLRPTPGSPNGASLEPVSLRINEWMASNDGSIRDPADLDSDDWFELFNPGTTEVDLEGWFLTDLPTNPTKFRIPAGYRISPAGFLLVWADEESGQNHPTNPDLHVNFRLATGGEEIVLLRPDGVEMDRVSFGAQTTGISQGRRPDGAPGTDHVFFTAPTPGRANVTVQSDTPRIVAVDRGPGQSLRVQFVSRPGIRYRLRATEDLGLRVWIPSSTTVTATGATTELEWLGDEAPHRFVQVEVVP